MFTRPLHKALEADLRAAFERLPELTLAQLDQPAPTVAAALWPAWEPPIVSLPPTQIWAQPDTATAFPGTITVIKVWWGWGGDLRYLECRPALHATGHTPARLHATGCPVAEFRERTQDLTSQRMDNLVADLGAYITQTVTAAQTEHDAYRAEHLPALAQRITAHHAGLLAAAAINQGT